MYRNSKQEIVLNISPSVEILMCDRCNYYGCFICKLKRLFKVLNMHAALLDPPPNPAPVGIFLFNVI